MGVGQANIITPGPGSSPPDVFTFSCPSASCPTLLGEAITPWANSTSTISGNFVNAVFSDPNNVFGAGDLDFMYQVANISSATQAVVRVTAGGFTGFQTDVGDTSSTFGTDFALGTFNPLQVDRFSPGDSIGFGFFSIPNGFSSEVLVIETNATQWTGGPINTVSIIDGGGDVIPQGGFEPIPEPAAVLLIGSGLLVLMRIRGLRGAR